MIGKTVWFDVKKGYGFINSEGKDIFVHYSKIIAEPGEFRLISEGDVVEFELFYSDRGNGQSKPQAKNVKIITGENSNEIVRGESVDDIGRQCERAEVYSA